MNQPVRPGRLNSRRVANTARGDQQGLRDADGNHANPPFSRVVLSRAGVNPTTRLTWTAGETFPVPHVGVPMRRPTWAGRLRGLDALVANSTRRISTSWGLSRNRSAESVSSVLQLSIAEEADGIGLG